MEFVSAEIPDDPADDVLPDMPRDVAPPTTDGPTCQVCGIPLEYAGRGRKPTRCAEHKRGGGGNAKKAASNSTALGKQAAAVLGQLNGLLATGLMLAPMPYRLTETASAIANANDGFEEAAAKALSSDPKLAKLILKGGEASGKVALIIAYGMLAGAVAPVAVLEYRANVSEGKDE